jgi:hypothetical protein
MESLQENYKSYRWFYTSNGKLVIGGKSAQQNEQLLKKIKSLKNEFIVMHTSSPGSPFSVILEDPDKLTKSDLEETAHFTGCFSRAWREGKQKANVDIFLASHLNKNKSMKEGTWGVSNILDRLTIDLKLVIVKQNGILRAVPPNSANKSEILAKIVPGKVDKSLMIQKLNHEMGDFNQQEIISALPSGGIKISK